MRLVRRWKEKGAEKRKERSKMPWRVHGLQESEKPEASSLVECKVRFIHNTIYLWTIETARFFCHNAFELSIGRPTKVTTAAAVVVVVVAIVVGDSILGKSTFFTIPHITVCVCCRSRRCWKSFRGGSPKKTRKWIPFDDDRLKYCFFRTVWFLCQSCLTLNFLP